MNEKVIEAVEALKVHIDYQPKIGIILGSGLGGLAQYDSNFWLIINMDF
jgi:purine nucleoside phosphorylase